MTASHDFICSKCDQLFPDHPINLDQSRCPYCKKGKLIILWTSPESRPANVHASERAVVFISDRERKVQYPMSNSTPMPKRLQQRGYRRLELNSASDLRKLERQEGVASHALNYDRGTGHSYDGSDS